MYLNFIVIDMETTSYELEVSDIEGIIVATFLIQLEYCFDILQILVINLLT